MVTWRTAGNRRASVAVVAPVETRDRIGRANTVGVLVILGLFLAGVIGLSNWLEPLNHRCSPDGAGSPAAERVVDDLGAAASRLPGVVAVEAGYTPGDCDSASVALTVGADADPGRVAAAVAFVAAGLDAPEVRAVHDVAVSVEDDGPEHSPGGGRPSLHLADRARAPDAVAAVVRAWVRLKGHYRATSVEIGHYSDSIRVQLPRPSDAVAVREAFDVLRGLGLTGSAGGNLIFWEVGVAGPGPIRHEPDTGYGVRGDLTAEGLTAIEAAAGWSADLGPEIASVTKAHWSAPERGDAPVVLTVRATVDVDAVGRTVDDVADDLAARLAASGAPHQVVVAARDDPPRSAERGAG